MIAQRPYLSLIQQAAQDIDISVDTIETNILYRLRYGSHSWLMYNVDPGLNDSTSFQLAKYKSLTYTTLADAGIRAVPHHFLANPDSPRGRTDVNDEAKRWLAHYKSPLVVKPDDGAQGRQVCLASTHEQLCEQLTFVFRKVQHAVLSPYRHADREYRVVVLDGESKLMFSKVKAEGEWRHNLALGARAREVDPELILECSDLAVKAAAALGLSFCSVDILDVEHEGRQVLEVNGTVYLSEYMKHSEAYAKNVYELYLEVFRLKIDRLPAH